MTTSIQYIATLSPNDGSFFTQVSPAVRAAFVVLFDLCVEVFPEATNGILYRSVEAVLKDPRISINKSHAARAKRMVYEFSLTYPSAFYRGGRDLEHLMNLVKTHQGEAFTASRPASCRSPWVRSLIENVFKQALDDITPVTRVDMLRDWVVLTRDALKDNQEISDFKELAEIVLARFDHMELFKELIRAKARQTVIEVDASKIKITEVENVIPESWVGRVSATAPMEVTTVVQADPAAPFEEFFEDGTVKTASPTYQIYPGYTVNYERGGRNWGMYQNMVDSPIKVRLDTFEDNAYITILTSTYWENDKLVYEGGKIVYGNKQVISSDMSAFVRIEHPREYVVRSFQAQPGNEYLVTTWKNTQGLGDSCKKIFLVSYYGRVDQGEWIRIQEVNVGKSYRKLTLWLRPEAPAKSF